MTGAVKVSFELDVVRHRDGGADGIFGPRVRRDGLADRQALHLDDQHNERDSTRIATIKVAVASLRRRDRWVPLRQTRR